jgi:putative ABC transport system permease protein
MTEIRRFIRRLVTLFRDGTAESELAREVAAHLQLLEDQFVGKGMSSADAASAARRAFGGVEQAKERQRDARSFRWLAGWPMDLQLGLRILVKTPGLTVIAVIALAVAFGAGATYLQFVNGLIRPLLSFPGGDRLVGISSRDLEKNSPERRLLHDFRRWRDELTLIENLGASQDIAGDLTTDDGRAEPVDGVRISARAFNLVPASPLVGRPLVIADEDPSAPLVAVIGEALWQSRFNRDPLVVGRAVSIAGVRHTIVGVMPETFGFPVNHNLWIPFRDGGAPLKRGEGPAISVFGRLAPGVALEAAQAELAAATARAASADPASTQRQRTELTWYVPSLISAFDFKSEIVGLYAANIVFIALLALCAVNVATLVFGRTVIREAEITVRTALGASRGRIVSQLITEALVLASIGAGLGLAGASAALGWVRRAWETGQGSAMPFWWTGRLSAGTLLYTALLVIVAALIVGGIPALKATGAEMQSRLKDAGAGSTMRFGKLWTGIVVSQVAVTVVFLLSVVSLAWSIATIDRRYHDVAFQRSEYLTASFAPDTDGGPEDAAVTYRKRQDFLRRLMEAPAVEGATYTTRLPGADQESTYIESDGAMAPVRVAHIGPGFFETFDRKVIAGRPFTPREIESGASVGLVDESFVRHMLGGRFAVGQQVREAPRRENGEPGRSIEIVGVTEDMSTSARKTIRDARLYRPIGALPSGPVNLVVHARPGYRTEGLGQVAAAVRAAVAAVPSGIRVSDARPMNAGGGGDVIEYVFTALGIVGAVALLLSTAGIYSLIAFTLARRTREIGLRTALGASPRRIVTGMLSKAFLQIGLGVAAGVVPGVAMVASVAADSGRNGLADGIIVAAAVAAFVLIVAAAACSVPLRRALRIEPTEALRLI